jgi:hypothetical protein
LPRPAHERGLHALDGKDTGAINLTDYRQPVGLAPPPADLVVSDQVVGR